MKPFLAFDMGNVLLPFDHMRSCQALGSRVAMSADAVYTLIFASGLSRRFESGEISSADFVAACQSALGRELPPEYIRAAWSDIFVEDVRMKDFVASLVDKADLCLVSNTNELHFNWVSKRFPVIALFPKLILSYEVGAMKPTGAIFEAAAQHVLPGQSAFYIDDIAEFASAAELHGFRGICFRGCDELHNQLKELHIIQ